jgi:hypothetical protein
MSRLRILLLAPDCGVPNRKSLKSKEAESRPEYINEFETMLNRGL